MGRKKKQKNKIIPKNEFRFNYSTGHPNYIYGETDKRYKGVGITHESETFGKKNMPLIQNPQKGKSEKAYIRNGYVSDKKSNFNKKPLKDFSFSKEDFANVKSKIRHKKRHK